MRRSEDAVTKGQRPDELNRYRKLIQQQILCHPDRLIFSLTLDEQKVWVKRRPNAKKLFWHRLHVGTSGSIMAAAVFARWAADAAPARWIAEA